MTGLYATAAKEGWENILNGKYFTGAAEVLSPLMFGESAWNKVAQGAYGGIQLLNENGIPKTWREIKEGNYGRAALSGVGDLFNTALIIPGLNLIGNNKQVKNIRLARELNRDIRNTTNLGGYSDIENLTNIGD